MIARRAVIRADASVEIGTGHIVRCQTLAVALIHRGWSVTMASRDLPPGLAGLVAASGITVARLPAEVAMADEPAWLARDASLRGSLLVVDHYDVGADWMEGCRAWAGPIMAIDDLADRPLPADLILNQNLGAQAAAYRALAPDQAEILVGPAFALLRPEFAAAHDRGRERTGEVRRILVFMSGADPANVTGQAAEAADASRLPVDVVVGGAYPHLAGLRSWAGGRRDVSVHVDTAVMADLMEAADLAIGAPGSASWERCALGLPSILVILAENQREAGRLLASHRAALTVGWYADTTATDIGRAIRALQADPPRVRSMSAAAARITDGRGTERVVAAIETIAARPRTAGVDRRDSRRVP
jgi:UDP-2,4-diacetamido-2,4,6-trideoxy-beta-L-altropyranose hydrolase